MGTQSTWGVRKMLSVVEIKANVAYFYFLRGLLYLLRILPTTYSKYILISTKTLIGTLPFVWIGILSVLTVVMQGFIGKYLFGSKKIQKERADAHQVEVNRLQQCIENEKKIQTKKIDSIETRLDKLKLNLKKGILGVDKVLQGIQMESPIRNSKGDYGKENFDTIVKKSPLVEVKN